jgi:hypothetical protein
MSTPKTSDVSYDNDDQEQQQQQQQQQPQQKQQSQPQEQKTKIPRFIRNSNRLQLYSLRSINFPLN